MSEVQKPVEDTPVVAAAPAATIAEPAPTTTSATTVEPTPATTSALNTEETPAVSSLSTPAPLTTTSDSPAVAIAGASTTETPTTAAAATSTSTAAAETAAVKEDVKPVEEGVLGYKAPGLIKSFIFSKKHFWFSDEPVETKHLASYLRGEKPEHANHNAAWSSHTGKGLLFFSKKHTEKATPAGIINLSAITSDVTTEGPNEFHFLLDGHKHTFQANTASERDNWVSVLKTKIAEAKEMATSVTESETYKKTHGHLSKPILGGAAAVAPKKSEEKKAEKTEEKIEKQTEKKEDKIIAEGNKKQEKHDHAVEKEIKKEEKAEKEEVKDAKKSMDKTRTSRSQSRKRQSIFGAIPGFGPKKDEKLEDKKEEVAAAPHTTPAVTEPVVAPAATSDVTPAAVAPTTAPVAATEEPVAERPSAPTKRSSLFGTLKQQFTAHKDKKPETESTAPVVPAKDTVAAEPVSETAPVIPAVETTEPLATSVASPATVPTEVIGDSTATTGETKAAEVPTVKSDKRKSSLPFFTKKEKATSSDEEGDSKLSTSPFAKLRATVKGKSSPKVAAAAKEDKAEEKKEEKLAEGAVPAPISKDVPAETTVPATATTATAATPAPVVTEPVSAAPTSTAQVSATA